MRAVSTVSLGIPDPPSRSHGSQSRDALIKFIRDLYWSGLIVWEGDLPRCQPNHQVKTKSSADRAGFVTFPHLGAALSANPNATRQQIFDFAGELMKRYGISSSEIHPYGQFP